MIEALLPDGRRVQLEHAFAVVHVYEPVPTAGAYSAINPPSSFPQTWTLRLMGVENGTALYEWDQVTWRVVRRRAWPAAEEPLGFIQADTYGDALRLAWQRWGDVRLDAHRV